MITTVTIVQCDMQGCPRIEAIKPGEGTNMEKLDREGWRFAPFGGKWRHYCPAHARRVYVEPFALLLPQDPI